MGTAHFTQRSLQEAYDMVRRLRPQDLAIELDLQRYKILNDRCLACPSRGSCVRRCEFIGATDALGNADAYIWLIDVSEGEIARRIRGQMTSTEYSNLAHLPRVLGSSVNEARLWERGFKDLVMQRSMERLQRLREYFPSIWRVLIDERNTLMAARLAWIVTKRLDEGIEEPKTLALVGAAHVEGGEELLRTPLSIRQGLRRLGLSFSPPTPIRRIKIT
ncbi:MAG: TraB/GumN family protein [Candidatus Geothermarchaeales archaeon]